MTDEWGAYKKIGKDFAAHHFVQHHAGEYVNYKDRSIHTQTIEGYFSIFKRGMRGIYQHCGKQHLHRYAAELGFRYNHRTANDVTDTERAALILKAAEGRRLTYRGLTHGRVPNQRWSRKGFQRILKRLLRESEAQ